MELLIIEQNGWTKPFQIARSITRVGSAPSNDVQLDSAYIAPLHFQIFFAPEVSSACKVINVAGAFNIKSGGITSQLPTWDMVEVKNGDEIQLAGYRLQINLPLNSSLVRPSRVIEASLNFADAVLRPEFPSTGRLTIKNNGDMESSQFVVSIQGLREDCYQVDPLPLMYPGAQEEIRVRLFHQGSYPEAGYHTIFVKVSAPESYPGEELLLEQNIYVTPVFKQNLEIIDDLHGVKKTSHDPKIPAGPVSPPPVPPAFPPATAEASVQPVSTLPIESSAPPNRIEDVRPPIAPASEVRETPGQDLHQKESSPEFVQEESRVAEAPAPGLLPSKPKVIRGPSEQFWNE